MVDYILWFWITYPGGVGRPRPVRRTARRGRRRSRAHPPASARSCPWRAVPRDGAPAGARAGPRRGPGRASSPGRHRPSRRTPAPGRV